MAEADIVVPEGHDIEKLVPELDVGVQEPLEALTVPPPDGLTPSDTVGSDAEKSAVTVPPPLTVTVLPDIETPPLRDQPFL